MKRIVILGAGTAGTMIANGLAKRLPAEWSIVAVDPEPTHVYQPGFIFLPFGARDEAKNLKPRHKTLHQRVEWIQSGVDRVDPEGKRVALEDGRALSYDLLVIASGSRIRPEETEGLLGEHWHRTIHDFYTLEGALALREALEGFDEGRLVVNVVEMPIKCPVAPLEFLFLADAYFTDRGRRDRIELVYATPLDSAFTKPVCADVMGGLLEEKGIRVETEYNTGEVDGDTRQLRSWDGRTIDYDLLVSIPVHSGAEFVERSGLGDELGFVPTHKHLLTARDLEDVFVLGDATNLPSSKAGSVAHFQSEVLLDNLVAVAARRSPTASFDGHANCFVESGHGRALLIDFNYDTEPYPGTYPLPMAGPFQLLKESRVNHWGKLAFRPLYWRALLPALPIPVTAHMSMAGKRIPVDLRSTDAA